jgi:mRNA interferase MazF
MTVQRGDVVLTNFPFSSGGGAKMRPALVVQTDRNNRRLSNTIVAMVTRSTKRAQNEPTQYLLDPATSEGAAAGVLHPSTVKCENLFTVEQRLIVRKIGRIPATAMKHIDRCLKTSLELP